MNPFDRMAAARKPKGRRFKPGDRVEWNNKAGELDRARIVRIEDAALICDEAGLSETAVYVIACDSGLTLGVRVTEGDKFMRLSPGGRVKRWAAAALVATVAFVAVALVVFLALR